MRYHNFDLVIEERDERGYRIRADSEDFDTVRGRLQLDPNSGAIVQAVEELAMRDTDSEAI